MTSLALRRELALATRRLMTALRVNREVTKAPTGESKDDCLPAALESLRIIEDRTAKYLQVLTRYRASLEDDLERRPKQTGPRQFASRIGQKHRPCEVRRAVRRSSSDPAGRKRHRG
jgi:hypothetical protein